MDKYAGRRQACHSTSFRKRPLIVGCMYRGITQQLPKQKGWHLEEFKTFSVKGNIKHELGEEIIHFILAFLWWKIKAYEIKGLVFPQNCWSSLGRAYLDSLFQKTEPLAQVYGLNVIIWAPSHHQQQQYILLNYKCCLLQHLLYGSRTLDSSVVRSTCRT